MSAAARYGKETGIEPREAFKPGNLEGDMSRTFIVPLSNDSFGSHLASTGFLSQRFMCYSLLFKRPASHRRTPHHVCQDFFVGAIGIQEDQPRRQAFEFSSHRSRCWKPNSSNPLQKAIGRCCYHKFILNHPVNFKL